MTNLPPKGFVKVNNDVDASIQSSIRYSENHNFTGMAVTGSHSGDAIWLTEEAASQLSKVQRSVQADATGGG